MARGPFEGCRPRRQHLPELPPQEQEAAGPLCPLCSSTNLQTPAALSVQGPRAGRRPPFKADHRPQGQLTSAARELAAHSCSPRAGVCPHSPPSRHMPVGPWRPTVRRYEEPGPT